MSLDVWLEKTIPCQVYEDNITHNLTAMASAAGLYKFLWRPEELGITTAKELIAPLRAGLSRLIDERAELEKLNPDNGWGNYDGLVSFVRNYLAACEENPDATVRISR